MTQMYYILGLAGWIWLVLVGLTMGLLWYNQRRKKPDRGFDVIVNKAKSQDEK